MRRLRFAILLCLLAMPALRADDAPSPAPTPVTDPALVVQHYRQVLTQPQFQEADEPPLNSRFTEWLSDWFRRLGAEFGDFKYASRMPAFESLLMTLLVVFCISILLYVMARLTRKRQSLELEPAHDSTNPNIARAPEFYDEEIDRAIRAGDWHAAWLASWRQFLSRLEHRQLVESDRTRTNREYLAQMREKSLSASALTLLTGMVDAYDRFIYGRRPIDETEWNSFHRQIDEAVLLLHLDAKRAVPPPHGSAS